MFVGLLRWLQNLFSRSCKYLPHMSYFEGVDIKRLETELKAGKTYIVSFFHKKSIFRANEEQRFFRLWNDEQVLLKKAR